MSTGDVEIDREAGAAYLWVRRWPVASTREVTPQVLVDLDECGIVVGVEVLGLDASIPREELVDALGVPAAGVDRLVTLLAGAVQAGAMRAPGLRLSGAAADDGSGGHGGQDAGGDEVALDETRPRA